PLLRRIPHTRQTSLLSKPDPPIQVKSHEADKVEATDVYLPVDPAVHVRYTYVGNFCYGLYVQNKLLCCGDGAIRPSLRVDNQNYFAPQAPPKALPVTKNGKQRTGMQCSFTANKVTVTKWMEVLPSKVTKSAP